MCRRFDPAPVHFFLAFYSQTITRFVKSLVGAVFGCGVVLLVFGFIISNPGLLIAGSMLAGSGVIAEAIERQR
jgi:hypothetical protein